MGPWSTGCCPCERSLNTPPLRQSPPNKAALDTQDQMVSKNRVLFRTLSGWLKHVLSGRPPHFAAASQPHKHPPTVQVSRPCAPLAWCRLHPAMGLGENCSQPALDDQRDRGGLLGGEPGRKQTDSLSEWGQRCGTLCNLAHRPLSIQPQNLTKNFRRAEPSVSWKPTVSGSVLWGRKDELSFTCLPSSGPYRKPTHGNHKEHRQGERLPINHGETKGVWRESLLGQSPTHAGLEAWKWVRCVLQRVGRASLVGWGQDMAGRHPITFLGSHLARG